MLASPTAVWTVFALSLGLANAHTISFRQGHVLPTSAAQQEKTAHPKATSSVYEVFEVYPPVLAVDKAKQLVATNADPDSPKEVVASSIKSCKQTLAVHSFANSYGAPYVGDYTPPSCSFNSVTWNLTVQTSGIQYDRLGSVSFDSTELFRTSTIEPDINVTQWTYLKDMSPFLSLFSSSHKLIFDLPNIIDTSSNPPIDGDYNVTLTATYFTVETMYDSPDKVFTISQDLGSKGMASYFTFPQQNASSSVTLPRNIKKAIYTVVAVGQAEEEFWWAASLNSEARNPPMSEIWYELSTDMPWQINTFPNDTFYGFSPFREVQVFIDGNLAGVSWPFPILFSGADDPSLWQPIGGIDVLDLKEYEIDITPWLPLLCDGKAHTFTMMVSGLNNTGTGNPAVLSETVMDDWFLGGKIFVWSDKAGHVTTGTGPVVSGLDPTLSVSSSYKTNAAGKNTSLTFEVNAKRNLAYHSTIKLSTGTEDVFWSQRLGYSAKADVTHQGEVEVLNILTNGYEVSSSGYAREFNYPFYVDSTETYLEFSRGKNVNILGQPVFPTGLETFFSDWTGKGSSSALQQVAIYNNGTVSASTQLTFGAIEADGSPKAGSFPAVKSNQTLFTQAASAQQSILQSDLIDFVAKPKIDL